MAINPPSDIVLDVARAADPEKYRVAAERLARLRATTTAAEASPPRQAAEGDFAAVRRAGLADPPPTTNRPLDGSATVQPRGRPDAYSQFEAFVLQSCIQSMLPRNATNVFGRGSAGEFWRSMLAEKMGDELARGGQVGIARRIAGVATHAADRVSNSTAGSLTPPFLSTLSAIQRPAPDATPGVDVSASTSPPASERS